LTSPDTTPDTHSAPSFACFLGLLLLFLGQKLRQFKHFFFFFNRTLKGGSNNNNNNNKTYDNSYHHKNKTVNTFYGGIFAIHKQRERTKRHASTYVLFFFSLHFFPLP